MKKPKKVVAKPLLSKAQRAVVRKWITALRSGKYKQGRGLLRDESDRYCCLGVLCDVVAPRRWRRLAGVWYHDAAHSHVTIFSGAPVDRASGIRLFDGLQQRLTSLNDDDEAGFRRIASYIERQMLK